MVRSDGARRRGQTQQDRSNDGIRRAWRAAAMWRTSWLSREVIVLPVFMGLVLLYGGLHYFERPQTLVAGEAIAGA